MRQLSMRMLSVLCLCARMQDFSNARPFNAVCYAASLDVQTFDAATFNAHTLMRKLAMWGVP